MVPAIRRCVFGAAEPSHHCVSLCCRRSFVDVRVMNVTFDAEDAAFNFKGACGDEDCGALAAVPAVRVTDTLRWRRAAVPQSHSSLRALPVCLCLSVSACPRMRACARGWASASARLCARVRACFARVSIWACDMLCTCMIVRT